MIDDKVQDLPLSATDPPPGPRKDSAWRRLLSQTPEDFQRRRERHRRRPIIVRIVVGMLGGILAIAGILMLVPVPDMGLPLLLFALGLLALEFDWAARLLGRVIRWAEQFRIRFHRLSRTNKALSTMVVLGIIALGFWIAFMR